jgi:hypothetical protein
MINFYQTEEKAALTALSQHKTKAKDLKAAFDVFANEFNAKAVFAHSVHGVRFHGLALNNPYTREDAALWTKPKDGVSNIRSRITGKENAAKLRELKSRYQDLLPEVREVSLDNFFDAIGTHWGDIVFSGIAYFELDGVIYIKTRLTLEKNVLAISEKDFDNAKAKSAKE